MGQKKKNIQTEKSNLLNMPIHSSAKNPQLHFFKHMKILSNNQASHSEKLTSSRTKKKQKTQSYAHPCWKVSTSTHHHHRHCHQTNLQNSPKTGPLNWYDIDLWRVFTSQNNPLETCWKDTLGPLASCGDGLRWRHDHEHIIIPLDHPHHTNSAPLFNVPTKTSIRALSVVAYICIWGKHLFL